MKFFLFVLMMLVVPLAGRTYAQRVKNFNFYDLWCASVQYKENGYSTKKSHSVVYNYDVTVSGWKRIPSNETVSLDFGDVRSAEVLFVAVKPKDGGGFSSTAVSYTHLTLPTKRIV